MSKVVTEDEVRLAKLGYKQELNRGLKWFHNLGLAFSHISFISGITGLFTVGLTNGGPMGMSIGWLIISVLTISNAASMAEICSTYPTAGGLYYWSAKLGGEVWGPFASWVNAWFNLVGQIAFIAASGPILGAYLWSMAMMSNADLSPNMYITTSLGIAGLVLSGLLNCFSEKVLSQITLFSIALHVIDLLVIVIWLLAASPMKQSASFVFGTFINGTGWSSDALVFQLGLLLPSVTLIGQDASAHISEETEGSDKAAPQGIFQSVLWSAIFGTGYLYTLLFCIQDIDAVLASPYPTLVAQLSIDAIGHNGALFILVLLWLTQLVCTVYCIASSSRMMYAFSRDKGLPFSKFFHWVHPETLLPLRTIALSTFLGSLFAAIGYGSPLALSIESSVTTVAMLTAYTLPILMRVTVSRDTFKPGPFNLGRFSVINGVITCVYVGYMFVLLCLPQVVPVTGSTMNYALPLLAAVILGSSVSWIWAKEWFKGPALHISVEEVAEMEALAAVKKDETAV